MNYERTRAIVVATLRLALENVADANAKAERDTDAGTRDPFPQTRIEPDPDDVRDRKIQSGEWDD